MNKEEIAIKLHNAKRIDEYKGDMTSYAIQSIEQGRSNYPVANLINYCRGVHLQLCITDMTTEDSYRATSILDVHKVIKLMMKRYGIDMQGIYQLTGIHYTPPSSFDTQQNLNKKHSAPLSINTLLAVCDALHCDLSFCLN